MTHQGADPRFNKHDWRWHVWSQYLLCYLENIEVVFECYQIATGRWYLEYHLSPLGVCSVAIFYTFSVVFVYFPHGSTGWCLRWEHMALMCRYDWVWTALKVISCPLFSNCKPLEIAPNLKRCLAKYRFVEYKLVCSRFLALRSSSF